MYQKSLCLFALLAFSVSTIVRSEELPLKAPNLRPVSTEYHMAVTAVAVCLAVYCIYKGWTTKPLHVFYKQGSLQESVEYRPGDIVRIKTHYANRGTVKIVEHDDTVILIEAYMHGTGDFNPILIATSEGMCVKTECGYADGYETVDFVITVPRGVSVQQESGSYYTSCSSEHTCWSCR